MSQGIPSRLTLNTTKPLLWVLKAASLLFFCLPKFLPLLPPSFGPGDPTSTSPSLLHLLRTTLSLHPCDRSHLTSLHLQLPDMVLLTPKFVFVAALASLTAFSLAPTADAAAIAMRRDQQYHPSDSSGTWSGTSLNHANHPILPLPARLTSASGKQVQDKSGKSSRGSFKVTCSPPVLLVPVWTDC